MKLGRAMAAAVALSIFTAAFHGINVAAAGDVTTLEELKTAFATEGEHTLAADIEVTNSGIVSTVTIDGNGQTLTSVQTGNDSTIFQNADVESTLKNLTIQGNTKGDVGIWEGVGTMTLTDCNIKGYTITSGRYAAIAVGAGNRTSNGTLTLNNVKFQDNGTYDIDLADSATLNVNAGTSMSKLRLQSNTAKLNIGDNWSGSFEITMDSAANVTLGTVGAGADITGITVSNEGYVVENSEGNLIIKSDTQTQTVNGAEITFDMNNRSTLYKGSTGFLYGESEINVPTLDLMYGLKPKVMVQKALGGLQHPTGDAARVKSAAEAVGADSIQVYLQDIYLEWPYNAPFDTNGALDVAAYAKTCEEILYGMICDKANEGDNGAFLGSDGNHYKLNAEEAAKYSYVLFNEPDNIWYGGNLSGLEAAWKTVYEAVHKIDPNAKCAGPNFAVFNSGSYDGFIKYCAENNCLPEIITWHELNPNSPTTQFARNYDAVKRSIATYYPNGTEPELVVNEYATHSEIGAAGRLVKWLAMFEDKDMDGCMAYWAMANSLNEMAADQNSPASTWWIYHWYAQMIGEQCAAQQPALADNRFYGVASYDDEESIAYAIFGGNSENNSAETVYFDNMDKTKLVGTNNATNVKVYGVSYSGQQGATYKPEIIFDGAVNVDNNKLTIQITDTNEMDAYFAVITPTDKTGAAMENIKIPTLSYEAEDGELLGGARIYERKKSGEFGLSGNKNVGSINNNGDGVKFTVDVPETGTYDLGLFYSMQAPYVNAMTLKPDASGQNRGIGQKLPFGMQVDGGDTQTLYLDTTISWNYTTHHNTDVYLTEGEHTITFKQINGDEGSKGNLQLVATVDKIDLDLIADLDRRYDFEIDITEQTNFKDGNVTRVSAVAPKAGYYSITGDGDFTLTRRSVDYAPDAKSFSECEVYDIPVTNTVYLAQGANTIGVAGDVGKLSFAYDKSKTEAASTVITADNMTIHGSNAYYKSSAYAESGKVISELGIGQNAAGDDNAEDNYIDFKLNAPTEGVYNLAIRYANDEPAPVMLKTDGSTYVHPYNIDLVERFAQIKVNNGEPETVYFRNTMSWDTFKTLDIQVRLNAGENTIKIYNDNSYQFSSLVNSTAPEIDTVTVTKQSYDGEKTTAANTEQGELDVRKLDEIITTAQVKISNSAKYSDATVDELKKAIEKADRSSQSKVNESYITIKEAIDGLRPGKLKLADYYATSYASTSVGTPSNSFDGNESTVWTTNRVDSPYAAYEVFYAGDGKVFDLNEIEIKSNGQVVILGTNSDNILKSPSEVAPDITDLVQSGSNTYRNFASAYDAAILGSVSGNAAAYLNGQYRYLVVAPNKWSETDISEITLSAEVEDSSGLGADIIITPDTDKTYADFDIRYDNLGSSMNAYFAAYDKETNVLITVKSEIITNNALRLEIPVQNGVEYTYKAFLWDDNMKPLHDFVGE